MKQISDWEEKLTRISVRKEQIGESILKYTLNGSSLMFCQIWAGVILWSNEIKDDYIPFFDEMNGNYITFNYCSGGRCEIEFPVGNRFIYMERGMISLNQVLPVEGYHYPGRKYDGLELAFDLDVLKNCFPTALADYGLTEEYLRNVIQEHGSLLLASVNQRVQAEFDRLLQYLRSGNVRLETLRYEVLRLFFLLKEEGLNFTEQISYVSKGQRQIVTEVEKIITRDLSSRHVLSELAADYGISASALKKYFVKVYGNNVSDYLRIQRMDMAKKLLSGTTQSVGEIAMTVGYAHQGKFSEAFKEHTGCSPLEYRRLHFNRKGTNE